MTEDSNVKTVDLEEIKLKAQELMEAGDFAGATKILSEGVKAQKAEEKAALEAKQSALAESCGQILNSFKDFLNENFISNGALDEADGVWFSWDFGDQIPTCRLLKKQATAAKSGNKSAATAGKTFEISTEDLIEQAGDMIFSTDGAEGTIKAGEKYAGKTAKEAYEADTDGNYRYGIRKALLKHFNYT